jgi:hypothetical protein
VVHRRDGNAVTADERRLSSSLRKLSFSTVSAWMTPENVSVAVRSSSRSCRRASFQAFSVAISSCCLAWLGDAGEPPGTRRASLTA